MNLLHEKAINGLGRSLRERIKQFGLRHSTVSAIMPCESSSVIQCSTNGIEPIRSYITYKKSKARTLPVIVPNYISYKNKYTLAYDMKDNEGLIKDSCSFTKMGRYEYIS